MSENLHSRRSLVRMRGSGVGTYHRLINQPDAIEKLRRAIETVPKPKNGSGVSVHKPVEGGDCNDLFSPR